MTQDHTPHLSTTGAEERAREALEKLVDKVDRFNGVFAASTPCVGKYQGEMILAMKEAKRVLLGDHYDIDSPATPVSRSAVLEEAEKAFAAEMDALVRTAEASPYHNEGSRNSVRVMRDASVRALARLRSLITNDGGASDE